MRKFTAGNQKQVFLKVQNFIKIYSRASLEKREKSVLESMLLSRSTYDLTAAHLWPVTVSHFQTTSLSYTRRSSILTFWSIPCSRGWCFLPNMGKTGFRAIHGLRDLRLCWISPWESSLLFCQRLEGRVVKKFQGNEIFPELIYDLLVTCSNFASSGFSQINQAALPARKLRVTFCPHSW